MEPVVYVLLFVTSVVGFTFIVERGIALRWRRVVPSQVEAAVESCQAPEDVPMLRRVCQQHKSPTSRLLLIAAEHLDWPKAEAVDAIQSRARQEIARLERGLVVLEIIVGIAPLLGLVGTILGMMTAFGNVGQAGKLFFLRRNKNVPASLLCSGLPWRLRCSSISSDFFIRKLYRRETVLTPSGG